MKVNNMGRITIVLIVLFISNFAFADGKKMIVKIDGMTCPSCAASVEGQFGKLTEVEEVDISISNGAAIVIVKEGKTLADDVIKEAVKKAGFEAVSIQPEG